MAMIVAVGNRSFVVALAGIGAESMRCDTVGDFAETLRKLSIRRDVRLVFAPEPMLTGAPDAADAFRSRSHAALLGLPLRPGEEHHSLAAVRHLMEQATGATLI